MSNEVFVAWSLSKLPCRLYQVILSPLFHLKIYSNYLISPYLSCFLGWNFKNLFMVYGLFTCLNVFLVRKLNILQFYDVLITRYCNFGFVKCSFSNAGSSSWTKRSYASIQLCLNVCLVLDLPLLLVSLFMLLFSPVLRHSITEFIVPKCPWFSIPNPFYIIFVSLYYSFLLLQPVKSTYSYLDDDKRIPLPPRYCVVE